MSSKPQYYYNVNKIMLTILYWQKRNGNCVSLWLYGLRLQCHCGKALKFLSVSTKQFKILREKKMKRRKKTRQKGKLLIIQSSWATWNLWITAFWKCIMWTPTVCFTPTLNSLLLMTVCCKHWPLLDTCGMYTIVRNSPTMWKPFNCFLQRKRIARW